MMEAILRKYIINEPHLSENALHLESRGCLGPAAINAYTLLLTARHFDIDSYFLSVENFLDVVLSEVGNFISRGLLERADQCLTIALSTVAEDLVFPKVADIYLMRSRVRADQKKRMEAVSDAVHAVRLEPGNIETHFHLSKCLAAIEKRAHSVQVLTYALACHDIDGHKHFVSLIYGIATGMAKLTDDEIDLRPLPERLVWLHDAPTWQTIVQKLAQEEQYNALGVVTIGTCANMHTCQTPGIIIFKAANIPGVNYKFLDIGKMLKSLCAQGVHQWHLQMAEFMIKREADVGTISKAFNQPLLVIMATLSKNGGVPSFLTLGFPNVPVTELDEQDEDGNTAFHALLKGFDKKQSKTIEILCRELISKGAIMSLRDSQGKTADEYIPKTGKLYKTLSEAITVSWPQLRQRLEKIRDLAKERMKASEFDKAIEIYEKGLSICQSFRDPAIIEEKLKLLTNLSIVNVKKGNFNQSLKHALESTSIDDKYWKGLYWVGVSYAKLEDAVKASEHLFLCHALADSDTQKNIIVKVLELFPKFIDSPAANVWLQYMSDSNNEEEWPVLLEKMTSKKLWTTLQILLLGPPFIEEGQGYCWGKPTSKARLQTIFELIDDPGIHADRLILALLKHGADIKTITSCPDDVLHEVVRFCTLTNDTSVLKHVLGKKKESGLDFCENARGQTPLHKLCYISGKRVTMDTKEKLARILCNAGVDPKIKDVDGKTASDYAPVDSALKRFLEQPTVTAKADPFKGDLKENMKWRDLKEKGNQKYKDGKYREAAQLYDDALKKAGKDPEATNREKAVLHGNLSECYLKQQLGHEALEQAEKCVAFDAQWYKGHLRVAKALTIIGMMGQATEAFINSYQRIQEKGYALKISVLSDLMECWTDAMRDPREIACRLCFLADPDSMLELAVYFLQENKWEYTQICQTALSSGLKNVDKQHSMDLGPFCNSRRLMHLTNGNWIVALLLLALESNGLDRMSSLKFHEGDTYFHAFVNVYLLSHADNDVLFGLFLRNIVRDKNIRDSRGNTVLHFLALKQGGSQLQRQHLTVRLIEFGVDTKAVNKDNKRAVDLCSQMDELKMVFQHFIQTEAVIEKRKNLGGGSLFSRDQSQAASKLNSSVPKQARAAQNTQTSKGAFKAQTRGQSLPDRTAHTSSQPRTSKIPEKVSKPRKPCDECEELMREAAQYKKEENESKVFFNLVSVVKKKHPDDSRHAGLKKTCFERLVANLVIRKDNDIPKSLLEIDAASCLDLINLLSQRGRWLQIYHLVLAFKEKKGWGSLPKFARSLSLRDFLSATSLAGNEAMRLKIFDFFMDNGGVWEYASSAELVRCAMTRMEFKVVLMLLERGSDPSGVTFTNGDSPLHAALLVALEKDVGNFALFDKLTSTDDSGQKIYKSLDLKCQDDKGDNLLHLAAKAEGTSHAQRIVEYLCKNQVPINQKNKDGRLPLDCLPNAYDSRASLLHEGFASVGTTANYQTSSGARPKNSTKMSVGKDIQGLRERMKETLTKLDDYNFDLLAPLPEEDEENIDTDEENSSSEDEDRESSGDDENISDLCHSLSEDENGSSQECEETTVDATAFDNLPWEVECTEEVWNVLKARKEKQPSQEKKNSSKRKERITDNMKKIIVGKIQDLASGQWRASLTKRIRHLPSSLQLHYIKLPQGGFILWELAVAFSARCSKLFDENDSSADQDSGLRNGRIYSEIIRVWSTSLSHSDLKSSIQRIKKSHQNGKNCVVKKNLKCLSREQFSQTSTPARIPKRYEETDVTYSVSEEETSTSLCPPASTGRTEYHILKFYSFSSNLVATILRNISTKVEFPFKVTDKEHELINLQSKMPLLLIGRSGTGKTTVCLYRLWSKFLGYWDKVGNSDHRILPRVLPATSDQDESDDDESDGGEDSKNEEVKAKEMKSNAASSSKANKDNLGLSSMRKESEPSSDESDATDEDSEADSEDEEDRDATTRKSVQVEYHHLHQVFVTKNPKLCSEVKKSFNRLCQATDFTICHSRDKDVLANTLDDMRDPAFPLFLTSRQLLILLDASVDGKPFFERDENLALKAVIPGWGTQRDIFHDIPLEVESSDDEIGGNAAASNHSSHHKSMSGPSRKLTGARPKHKDRPNRRECTYDVFAREVWPSIKKKGVQCHPSLVWTEIMSFIKGSYEALHTEKGYLDEKQYIDIGRKRAPNFSGDRSEIYKIFRGYMAHRAKNSLFDEADFIFNIYRRLSRMSYRKWVFHQIYVDEIQDFTQGELCLLINLSEDPNEMLLTGDTAQTIMRGISFRFEDLKSLFYYAQNSSTQCQKNQTAIKLPKGYELLKHNYRSHTGILSLASAVLNLLAEFFKDSFDVLEPDQGMFPGPLPVVIETCKPGDLAFLLKGNQRKTSHIEFGAHQAILVVNDEAKESVPTELSSGIVLSIYESKGLEFDDILIYNFFKDSKAIEEWRVVTSYLNSLKTRSEDKQMSNYGPVNLDTNVLEVQGRPHPLPFDPTKHKVLNAELKHLYTAVTRARVNVWIFDEDLNKRAPMFEYFKALKLVRCMRYDGEAVDAADTFIAEESSPREWRKKGDVFMGQKLYEQAAKCYMKAGATEKLHLAQAHQAAQEASRLRETENAKSHKVKLAFFQAGSMFVYCGALHYAAICFLNAKEVLLAAMAYEKNGEFEAAGHRYHDASEPARASKCFKKCGLFHQAVKVLEDGKEYERAIECLHEYESKIQDLTDQGKEIPSVLVDNRPGPSISENKLLENLMEEYSKKSDEKCLKSTIRRISNAHEQVRHLCYYKFFVDAAVILKNQGNFEEAVKLLIKEGLTAEAMDYAELSLSKSLSASVHLAISCRTYLDLQALQKEESHPPGKKESEEALAEKVSSHSTKARADFEHIDDKQGIAQTSLLNGMLKRKFELLKKAVKEFQTCTPTNHVGAIEAFKKFLNTKESNKLDESEIKTAIQVIQMGKMVIEALRQPSSKNANMELAYLMSYELHLNPQTQLVTWSANEVPLSLLTRQRIKYEKFKTAKDKSMATTVIWTSLHEDLTSWIELVEHSLNLELSKKSPCTNYQQGIINCVNPSCSHRPSFGRSKGEIMSTLTILLQKVALEKLPKELFEKQEGETEDIWRNVKQLLDFLPPRGQRLNLAPLPVIKAVISQIRKNSAVKEKLCRYFKFLWGNSGRVGRGRSEDIVKERAKESDWLIQTCFYERLLGLSLDVEKEAKDMEIELYQRGKEWLKKVSKYAIFAIWKQDQLVGVESLGGRFINSFKLLTGSGRELPDLFEAFFPFTKLLGAFGKRGNTSLMPNLDHLLFWMEFYSTLSFCFIAKIYQSSKGQQDHFFLPDSYKTVVDVVSICKWNNTTVEEDIMAHVFEQRHPIVMLFQRQSFLINLLCRDEKYSEISLIDCVKDLINGSLQDQLCAERILVLAVVLLLNMQLEFVDTQYQFKVRRSLQNLSCPSRIPKRLHDLIQNAKKFANGLEASDALSKFLSSCGISLCLASLDRQKKSSLQLHPPNLPKEARQRLMEKFPEVPQEEKRREHQETIDTANDGEVERPDQAELERELQNRFLMRSEEERTKPAAQTIIKCLRLNVFKARLKKKSFIEFERQLQFEGYVITDTFCGVCGCMMEDVANDNATSLGSHKESQEHLKKMIDFEMFKRQYTSQIHDNFRNLEQFLLKHEVWEKRQIYASIDVNNLLETFEAFQTMKSTAFALRTWQFPPVADCFYKLSNAFFQLVSGITSCYKAYQEEVKEESAQAQAVQDDHRDIDELDALGDFPFTQPKKGKQSSHKRNSEEQKYRKKKENRNN